MILLFRFNTFNHWHEEKKTATPHPPFPNALPFPLNEHKKENMTVTRSPTTTNPFPLNSKYKNVNEHKTYE